MTVLNHAPAGATLTTSCCGPKLGTNQPANSKAAGHRQTNPVIIADVRRTAPERSQLFLLAIHSILVMFIRPGIGMFVLL